MHPNPLFRQASRGENLTFARARGFGVVTVNGVSGPLAAHVPFWISPEGDALEFHLARSNPMVQALERSAPALVIVSGSDGYVSPDWYEMADQVPTWNYVAVHLRGTATLRPESELEEHLERLSSVHEAVLAPKPGWNPESVSPKRMATLMRAIVGVRLAIEHVDGTHKLGQNKPEMARLRAAASLEAANYGQEAAALARSMRESTK